ncbi:MAG: hypothetical protein AAF391_12575, partial [Bacteroidota bacterium]
MSNGITSSSSSVITANTSMPAPVAKEETVRGTNKFTANWDLVFGASSYKLFVSETNDFSSHVDGYNNLTVTGNSKQVTGLDPGKNYFYRLKAVGPDITSNHSNKITANTTISAPVALEESGRQQGGFTARWNSVSGAESYQLFVSETGSFVDHVAGFDGLVVTGTSQPVAGLASGRYYYYRIKAIGPDRSSAFSNVITANTSVGAPVVAAETERTTTSFKANWSEITSATEYRLDVSEENTFGSFVEGYENLKVTSLAVVGEAPPPPLTFRAVFGLTPGKNYFYRVRAVSDDITSVNSGVEDAYTSIDPPTLLAETDLKTYSFVANWDDVPGVASYRLDVSRNSSFTNLIDGYNNLSVSGTSRNVVGLDPSTTYYYRVKSIGEDRSSNYSVASNVTTHVFVPAPLALEDTDRTATTFVANWEAVAEATHYRIDVSTSSAFTSFVTGYEDRKTGVLQLPGGPPQSETSFTISNLEDDQIYYYRMRAGGIGMISDNSNTITAYALLKAGSISYDGYVCAGTDPDLLMGTTASGGDGSYTYRWQYWDGSTWKTLIEGSQYEDYDPTLVLNADTRFKRGVKSGDQNWVDT